MPEQYPSERWVSLCMSSNTTELFVLEHAVPLTIADLNAAVSPIALHPFVGVGKGDGAVGDAGSLAPLHATASKHAHKAAKLHRDEAHVPDMT